LSVQLQNAAGSGKTALYISTEAQLQTTRLNQILESHPKLAAIEQEFRPSLAQIQSTHIHDLEAQEHILRYQVPVVIERSNVGLVVVDSIAANYRAEFDKGKAGKGVQSLAKRSTQIAQLGTLLRSIASNYNIAVVVANQVADRFESQTHIAPLSQSTQRSRPGSPPHVSGVASINLSPALQSEEQPGHTLSTDDPLSLDHQQCFFTGWGDNASITNMKTPSLGLTWTNQLATRIALLKEPIYEDRAYRPGEDKSIAGWKRVMKVVFSAWSPGADTEYEIWQGGVRGLTADASAPQSG
jgi:DNA repair protein RAD57